MILRRSTSEVDRTHRETVEWDPRRGDRIGPAWDRILSSLGDGHWRPWGEVVSSVMDGSGLQRSTVNNLMYEGVKHGYLERRGRYSSRTKEDTRHIKISQCTIDSSALTDRGADR